MGSNTPPPPKPTPHTLSTLNSKPPHQLIRTTSCTCGIGHDHSQYGT